MNTVIFGRVARWTKLSAICFPNLESENVCSKSSIQYWLHKNVRSITIGRKGFLCGCIIWYGLLPSLLHWSQGSVHFGTHPFQPAQICAGSLVGQNCPANPGNVDEVQFMSLLYHAWLHRKSEWQFIFYAVSERKISHNTVEML